MINQEIEDAISLDPETVYTSTYVHLASPDIDFNTGNMKHSFWFKPEVTENVERIRMYAHRTVAIDIFSKLQLTLLDGNSDPVLMDNITTHEFSTYYPTNTDAFGTWRAWFTSGNSYEWQMFYQHYYDTTNTALLNISHSAPLETTGVYFSENNRVYQYALSDMMGSYMIAAVPDTSNALDMMGLNNQFFDASGNCVDYLRDYDIGDKVYFSDTIHSMEYDAVTNTTSFYFQMGDELILWKFSGAYEDRYDSGDQLNLQFEVVETETYGDYVFESLNYFEDVYALQKCDELPVLERYLN